MKILYITTISNTVNAFLVPHISKLIEEGYEVDIATNIHQELDQEIVKLGCEIYNVPFDRNPFSTGNIKAFRKIKEILNTNNYSVIHTHTPTASMISRLASRTISDFSAKVIYTAHGFHFYKGAPIFNWILYFPIEKIMSRFTDVIITINKEDYSVSKKYFSKPKVYYMPGVGIDLNKFSHHNNNKTNIISEELGISKNDFVLSYIAELNNNKNQLVLIESMNLLKKNKDVKLILIGVGENRELYESRINQLGLAENIKLIGYRKDIPLILGITDLYVASSLREGLPINVIEAMSMGLPIIASDNRGHRELVKHGKNGYLVAANNYKKFADLINRLYDDREKLDKFGEESSIKSKKYDIKMVEITILNITNKLIRQEEIELS